MFNLDFLNKDPQYINEKGTKFWHVLTDGKYIVYATELPDKDMNYIIVSGTKIIYENKQLESIGCRLDILKSLKL